MACKEVIEISSKEIKKKIIIVIIIIITSALNIISSYRKYRTQRTNINDCVSARSNIEYGVPQGSIFGPLPFDINMIDLFYECEKNDIANYADNTNPYSCGTDIPTVISELHYLNKRF